MWRGGIVFFCSNFYCITTLAGMIKFGIIGLGNIGKRHKSFIEENSRAEYLGAYDVNSEKSNFNNLEDLLLSDIDDNEKFNLLSGNVK